MAAVPVELFEHTAGGAIWPGFGFLLWGTEATVREGRYRWVVVVAVVILAAGYGVMRWWQGPQVYGYVIDSMPLVQTVVATGRVATVSRTRIGSEVTGVALDRLVEEGDTVEPGDPLLVLRADDIAARVRQAETAITQLETATRPLARVVLERTEFELAQARRELERRRALAARSLLSSEALEQAREAVRLANNALEAARLSATALAPGGVEEALLRDRLAAVQAELDKTVVRSEVSGTVLTRDVEPGDLVQPGRALFTIALRGGTEIRVPLDERNLSRLALGQNAAVLADAYPDQPFSARIDFIAPSIDPQRGTVEVRLAVDPVPEFLRQDMTVSVNIETGRRERVPVIPNDALGEVQGDRAKVWMLRDGRLQRQTLTLGLRGLVMSEVLAGLEAGDRVLADVSAPMQEGARVRFRQRVVPLSGIREGEDTGNEPPVRFD
ncbi:efflux RND transporter periplasmic adaptor subunit [Wenzhouxiangella sp. EGI_FJ10305]|uniref:efflux RND transporter periplasmic adaptor subunit n=1 Tax=Wenzhouxiangella sp. EGI_FJ10305 TaxID=3243768 RepID=UPI0035E00456